MAVSVVLSEIQRDVLAQVCDTFVPSLDEPGRDAEFYARAASDLMVPAAIEGMLGATAPEEQLAGFRALLDGLAEQGFGAADQATREATLHAMMDASPEALAGLSALRGLTLMLFYGLPSNPNWEAIGYPGPASEPPSPEKAPKTIKLTQPASDGLHLTADVVIVGSGAGGGVLAGKLAQAGKEVVVLEMGGYYNESDFNQQELWAYEHLYRGGGITQTANGSIALMAGSNLGGGTTVNWTNMLRTTPHVRAQWQEEFGLEGLAGADFDAHLDLIFERCGVNADCSDFNGPNQRMAEACTRLGFSHQRIYRNADPKAYEADTAGYLGFGDQSGSKQGTMKTFLQDASDAGARTVVGCRVDRVLTSGGRATGVEGQVTSEGGATVPVRVDAPVVVCAAGSLETPALLLRSGIGGPAAGQYLRLHPATGIVGIYEDAQKGWWGAPQTGLSAEWADLDDGYGFLVETSHASPGVNGSALSWESGLQHKRDMARGRQQSGIVFLIRDRGHGSVTIDAAGNAVHHYDLQDELDVRHFRRGLREVVRLHGAAGAKEILTFHRKPLRWREGEDLETYAAKVHDGPITPYDHAIFALHQMGSARMGTDPSTSVAGPWGELHDVGGVWIGDASAFPTATGTNPMATTMALASRTADAILAA